ncbi:SDR family oxidoreductase [Aspergillus stella-maris]|uniref:SDR family oxidoreductase n=1 Tax=Aspergillus stella-maris TaxID=1810926 RepID=UPI003CCD870D
MSSSPLVLVTGGTSFIAKWVLAILLQDAQNYVVRTTLRNTSRTGEIHASLSEAGVPDERIKSLQTVQADLSSDAGWDEAMKDVTYVLHVASPVPGGVPNDENELILPAVEGTKRVLRAARDAGAKRVVLTSSISAVWHGKANEDKRAFDENDWTDLSDPDPRLLSIYPKAKTLAERAAWEFIEQEGNGMELVSINPVNVLGPCLGKDDATCLRTVSELLLGNVPGFPRTHWCLVDVRDCATLHVLAMTHPKAAGERFICMGEGALWMSEIGALLKDKLGDRANKVPRFVLPDFLLKIIAIFMPVAKLVVPDLGVARVVNCDKAKSVLGWEWKYTSEEAVLAAAESWMKYNQS